MNPLSKLQSEAVKEYRQIFKGTVMWQEHESFLLDQIQKAYSEGLDDMFDELYKLAEPDERQPSAGDLNINLDDVHEIRKKLFIQSKEK